MNWKAFWKPPLPAVSHSSPYGSYQSIHRVYLLLIFLCACLFLIASSSVHKFSGSQLQALCSQPLSLQGIPENAWGHFWLFQLAADTTPVGRGQEAAKNENNAEVKKYCTSLSYGRTRCIHCLQHSAHSTARGTVGTQTQDKWMHVHTKTLFSVNF